MEIPDLETRIQRYLAASRLYIYGPGGCPETIVDDGREQAEESRPAIVTPRQGTLPADGMADTLIP